MRGEFGRDSEKGLKGYLRTDLMEIGQFQCVEGLEGLLGMALGGYNRRFGIDVGMDTEYEYQGGSLRTEDGLRRDYSD